MSAPETDNQVLFISDVHLGAGDPDRDRERESILVRFLRDRLGPGDRLFIVGDLFDFWFEYRTVIPKTFIHVLSCLRELTGSGVRIDYVAGNHDFWVGDFFRKELGLHFHSDPVRENIGGKEFYIIHGDGLMKNDTGYRFLKKVFRNSLDIFLYRWLHPDIGIPLAKRLSGSSRKHTSSRDFGGNEEYVAFAREKFAEGVDHVIMGHTHDPFVQRFEITRSLVNLGDWLEHFTYARFFNGELTLEIHKPGD